MSKTNEQAIHENDYHLPVLPDEVLSLMGVKPGGHYCDGTMGGGGHSSLILHHSGPDGTLIGCDQDQDALANCRTRLAGFGARVQFRHLNFAQLPELKHEADFKPFDGLLLDLGVSSYQLDTGERGFSLRHDGPLDMRMDQQGGGETAAELIARCDALELAGILRTLGEETLAKPIARAIKNAQEQGALKTTYDLAKVVEAHVPMKHRHRYIHPATKTFMALRMAVNGELEVLTTFLDDCLELMAPGGRLVIISFHSLEDRVVKKRFKEMASPCVCPPDFPFCTCGKTPLVKVVGKGQVAGEAELERNPRARSARVRAVEVLGRSA